PDATRTLARTVAGRRRGQATGPATPRRATRSGGPPRTPISAARPQRVAPRARLALRRAGPVPAQVDEALAADGDRLDAHGERALGQAAQVDGQGEPPAPQRVEEAALRADRHLLAGDEELGALQ